MKCSIVAALAAATTGCLAAPGVARSTTSLILPNELAIHSVNTNANIISKKIDTVRSGNSETTTLLSFPIPSWAEGMTCNTVVNTGKSGHPDVVSGSMTIDIFSTLLTDIDSTPFGNQRNVQLARMVFDPSTNSFNFDEVDVTPKIQNFPCPAGKTLQWEIVSVGTTDEVLLKQDFTKATLGQNLANGMAITVSN